MLGENANLYRLSKDNIPKIKGDIIRRPLGVVFDSVEKIYDGDKDITLELQKLNLNNKKYVEKSTYFFVCTYSTAYSPRALP